mmetsp:Transcript_3033/g.9448  ORF Transcript_3033/g.9448 Transcript_3033/m.9448 type:complete len:288 (-) Transcript_3033:358-1221(-)
MWTRRVLLRLRPVGPARPVVERLLLVESLQLQEVHVAEAVAVRHERPVPRRQAVHRRLRVDGEHLLARLHVDDEHHAVVRRHDDVPRERLRCQARERPALLLVRRRVAQLDQVVHHDCAQELPLRRAPHAHAALVVGHDAIARGVVVAGKDDAFVPGHETLGLAFGGRPDLQRLVGARGNDVLFVGRETQRQRDAGVPRVRGKLDTVASPHAACGVLAPCRNELGRRAESAADYDLGVLEGEHGRLGGDVPEHEGVVAARRREKIAAWAEHGVQKGVLVLDEAAEMA